MNPLQADEFLLTQRQWQWVAVRRAAVRRDSRLLRIGQPSIRSDAAQEVAAQRTRSGLGFGPTATSKALDGIALRASARNPAETERRTVCIFGGELAGTGSLPERSGALSER